jgi:DNA-directed RNA polymerase specialized sigma24 family protein
VNAPRGLAAAPFEQLLARLALSREEAGREYEALRSRLIRLFEGRRTADPEGAADDTLDRLARRVAEGVAVNEPAAYVLGIARLVALEHGRRDRRTSPLAPDHARSELRSAPDADRREPCLDRCLATIDAAARAALLEYYSADGRDRIEIRRRLAGRLAVTPTGLRLRMFRLRQDLEACVRACMDGGLDRPRNTRGVRDTSADEGRRT